MSPLALPVAGLAVGSAISLVGGSQLTAAWSASHLTDRERHRGAAIGLGLLGLGAALGVVASLRLESVR